MPWNKNGMLGGKISLKLTVIINYKCLYYSINEASALILYVFQLIIYLSELIYLPSLKGFP